ncbi:MAG TPA: CoA transferase [Candidatus Eisenbacteria bacterium]
MSPKPLEGILVLDLSRVLAGPWCTMVLGDMGARVIKVESLSGDDTRAYGPPFAAGESLYFLSINRNKESVTLDFQKPEGAALLRKLVARADVLIENFRPGTLERHGFGYADCAALNPRLVYASITGYGQEGPWRDRPGYDLVTQGEGGVMYLTGQADGPPLKCGVSQADITTGMWMVGGITTALYVRERSGTGQQIDLALADSQLSLLGFAGADWLVAGHEPARMGNLHPMLAPYATMAASDGWFNVAVGTPGQWRAFCTAVERPELADDARFATNADRVRHREALDDILLPLFRARPRAYWLARLAAADVPSGAVRKVSEALESEQAAARNMVVTLPHPTIGPIRQVGLPLNFSATPGAPRSAPPRLGEHTDAVLAELCGTTADELADLRSRGIVGAPPTGS